VKRRPEPGDTAAKGEKAPPADAEADLFETTMADVVRLPPDARRRVRPGAQNTTFRAPTPVASSSGGQDEADTSEAGFVAAGVDRRELRKLKRGDYAPGRRLDLHGQTAAEAVARVKAFIDGAHRSHRCVCIVHGRGLHSEGNVSVLRTTVRACLRQHRAVLAYADAPRDDGGPGAVYVLLRK
jgi:DNA-nicking Smr family endonuclease